MKSRAVVTVSPVLRIIVIAAGRVPCPPARLRLGRPQVCSVLLHGRVVDPEGGVGGLGGVLLHGRAEGWQGWKSGNKLAKDYPCSEYINRINGPSGSLLHGLLNMLCRALVLISLPGHVSELCEQ